MKKVVNVPTMRLARKIKRKLMVATRRSRTAQVEPGRSDYGNGNRVINPPKLDKTKITFKGTNNILFFEAPDTILSHSSITFEGSNAVVYISKHYITYRKHRYKIYAQADTTVFIGKDVNFHLGSDSMAYIAASEGSNVVIGDDCLFSLNLWIRTSDGHAAYDSVTKRRINPAGSVFIGDHVWIGQDVTVLKGSRIGSGCIIGAGSIVTGKTIGSNCSCAGTPARVLKHGVFFDKPNINRFSGKQLEEIEKCDRDDWIYNADKTTLSMDNIDKTLRSLSTSSEKLAYIKEHLTEEGLRNRFFIAHIDNKDSKLK
ncbi:acyltransferase [Candidatus Saccharibacteria bacterium]|nr:acyltransferase [Candidatus Saccharibacteria bacterium]